MPTKIGTISIYEPGIDDSLDTTLPMHRDGQLITRRSSTQMVLDSTLEQYARSSRNAQVGCRLKVNKEKCYMRLFLLLSESIKM